MYVRLLIILLTGLLARECFIECYFPWPPIEAELLILILKSIRQLSNHDVANIPCCISFVSRSFSPIFPLHEIICRISQAMCALLICESLELSR